MSTPEPIYSGEALLRNWSETANGKRRIVLEIEDNGGAHPFKGYEGERFAVVVMGPLASAEHEVSRKGKAAGDDTAPKADTPAVPTRFKQRWSDLRPSARAALLTKDPEFWRFLSQASSGNWAEFPATGSDPAVMEKMADAFLKDWLGITSKSELDQAQEGPLPPKARAKFFEIEGGFNAYRQAKGHGAIA